MEINIYKEMCKMSVILGSRLGLGVSKLTHIHKPSGYCPTCNSHTCRKYAYIPKYDHIWTWEERRKQFMYGWL